MKGILFALAAVLSTAASATEQGGSASTAILSELVYHPQRTAPATVASLNETTVSAQINAQIASIPVLIGDQVKQGTTLVTLDCSDYIINQRVAAAGVQSTQARLALAKSQLQRVRQLQAQSLSSQEDVDARIADHSALAADLSARQAEQDRAELAVERCTVKAPFDALVTERLVAKGQLANRGTPLISLIDQQQIELSAQVYSEDAALLAGAEVLTFDNGQAWPVTLRQVLNRVNTATRNREVRLLFNGHKPLPGTAGKLVWNDPRPYLPQKYIVRRGRQSGVFVVENNTAIFTALEGAQPGRDYPITLPTDTRLLVRNLATTQDGDSVGG